MPKATAVFDADDSRLSSALARTNGKMLALQSRIASGVHRGARGRWCGDGRGRSFSAGARCGR
jgi:hypothetical protein